MKIVNIILIGFVILISIASLIITLNMISDENNTPEYQKQELRNRAKYLVGSYAVEECADLQWEDWSEEKECLQKVMRVRR